MPHLFLRVLTEATPLTESSEEGDAQWQLSAEWLIRESSGEIRAQGNSGYQDLTEILDPNAGWLANPDNVVVILPSQFVLTIRCEVPGRNAAQIRRALPFAAEEFVAADIELMHIAHGSIKAGHPVVCNVVAHEAMQNWLACLQSIGLSPGYLVTDTQLLASGEDVVSLLYENGVVLVAAQGQAATVDADNLAFALSGLGAQQIYCINGELSDLQAGQLDPVPQMHHVALEQGGVFEYLVDEFVQRRHDVNPFINLLQKPYEPARSSNPAVQRWRGVLALAAIWVLVGFVGLVVQGWWAGSEADRLQAESFALYRTAFAQESQPISLEQLRRRMTAKLGGQKGAAAPSDFVSLLAHLANTIDAKNDLNSLNYQRDELSVEVMLSSYDDLDPIKSKLGAVGVAVDVTSAEQDGQKIRSRLRLRFGS